MLIKKFQKTALGLAVATLFTGFSGFVSAADVVEGPSWYGRFNVALAHTDWEGVRGEEDSWDLRSNQSRLGVKGSIALDGYDFKIIYGAEYLVELADTTNSTFGQRNIFLGLQGDWGRIIAGRHDTPLKQSEGKVDQFNDVDADIDRVFGAHNRDPNIIYYTTPKFANGLLTANIATILADDADIDGDGEKEDGLFDSISASLVAQQGAWYGAIAFHTNASYGTYADAFTNIPEPLEGKAGGRRADVVRLVGAYAGERFEFGLAFQQAEDVADGARGEDTALLASAAYKIDKVKLKAQLGQVKGDQSDEKRELYAIGADYNFNAKTRAFTYYSSLGLDKADIKDNTFAIGLEHNF
ncbi:MAG: porin [Cellvibrio sp.]